MRCHDPGGDLAGAGLFGLTGAARLGGVISAGVLVVAGEPVVTVGPQRNPVRAGMPRAARIGDLPGRQAALPATGRAGGLTR